MSGQWEDTGTSRVEDREWKCTHQFEILNATNEVGSVGPSTFNVHTIWKWKIKDLKKMFTLLKAFMLYMHPESVKYSAWCYFCLKDIYFSSWFKFNWNASNRIKDFWSATRSPFQSKQYSQKGIMSLFHSIYTPSSITSFNLISTCPQSSL